MVNLSVKSPAHSGCMNTNSTSADAAVLRAVETDDEAVNRRHDRLVALRSRHSQGLTRLMDAREDLRGVLPLADLVDDAVRWTA